jgi:hypothetical protein
VSIQVRIEQNLRCTLKMRDSIASSVFVSSASAAFTMRAAAHNTW